jgi:hypothetical protein
MLKAVQSGIKNIIIFFLLNETLFIYLYERHGRRRFQRVKTLNSSIDRSSIPSLKWPRCESDEARRLKWQEMTNSYDLILLVESSIKHNN